MLPPGNSLADLFVYASQRWEKVFPLSEQEVLRKILAEDLFGFGQMELRNPENIRLSESQLLTWMRAVKRVGAHEPVQYVTGKAFFYGLFFAVNPSVLIPRPETEELVEMILTDFLDTGNLRVIDFCTGSGCIPVSLKKNRNEWDISATDISSAAIQTACRNAEKHDVRISFFEGDLLSENAIPEGNWDIMVSNPPYIAEHEKSAMASNVLEHEPHLALFVPDNDAIVFYRHIAGLADERLNKGGRVYLELNPLYAEECARLFSVNFITEIKNDLSNKLRFLVATKR